MHIFHFLYANMLFRQRQGVKKLLIEAKRKPINPLSMKTLLLTFLLLATLVGAAQPQKVLAMENPWRTKRIFFFPGDYLVFRTHDGKAKYEGYIESVTDSMIVLVKIVQMGNDGDATNNVFRDYVPIREIDYVYGESKSYWRFFRKMVAGTGTLSGGYLLGATGFNHLYLDVPIDEEGVLIAAALMGTGILFNFLGKDRRKMGGRWRLRAMDF